MEHELKIDPEFFTLAFKGEKTFELRKNDRDYQIGDRLKLRETRHTGKEMREQGLPLIYTGRECMMKITHILGGYGLDPMYVCLSMTKWSDPAPGMAVQALAGEICDALVKDATPEAGGYDLEAGLFGPNFSNLVRRWAALEYMHVKDHP